MGEYEGVPEVLEESMMSYTSEPALEAAEAVENVSLFFTLSLQHLVRLGLHLHYVERCYVIQHRQR